MPPDATGAPRDVYSPRPAVYWAWVQPTFTAYGPCACYWNFNWGYGYGWIWDRGCYNPVSGVTMAGGGGAYMGRRLQQEQPGQPGQQWHGQAPRQTPRPRPGWSLDALRDRSAIIAPGGGANASAAPGGVAAAAVVLGEGGGLSSSSSSSMSSSGLIYPSQQSPNGEDGVRASGTSFGGAAPRRTLKPNVVYTAAAGAVEATVRAQAPPGSRVITPPPGELRAASVAPDAVGAAQWRDAERAVGRLDGSWKVEAAGVKAAGGEAGHWQDIYMSNAYFDPAQGSWGVEFRCRFRHRWNVRNTVTLLATVVKSGVITYGSGAGEEASPLGLAYPQVAVRGGTMLVTYTYSSYANVPDALQGVTTTGVPAYPGERRGRAEEGRGGSARGGGSVVCCVGRVLPCRTPPCPCAPPFLSPPLQLYLKTPLYLHTHTHGR